MARGNGICSISTLSVLAAVIGILFSLAPASVHSKDAATPVLSKVQSDAKPFNSEAADLAGHTNTNSRAEFAPTVYASPSMGCAGMNGMGCVEIANVMLSEKEIEFPKAMFRKIDTNGSDALERSEIKALAKSFGYPVNEETLSEVFQELDEDNNGTISLGEFIKWWISEERENSKGSSTLSRVKLKLLTALVHEGKADKFLEQVKAIQERIDFENQEPIHINGTINIGKELLGAKVSTISLQTGKMIADRTAEVREVAGLPLSGDSKSNSFVIIDFAVRPNTDDAEAEKLVAFFNDLVLVIRQKFPNAPIFAFHAKLVKGDGDDKVIRFVFHWQNMAKLSTREAAFLKYFPTVDLSIKYSEEEMDVTERLQAQRRRLLSDVHMNLSFKVSLHRGLALALDDEVHTQDQRSRTRWQRALSAITTLVSSGTVKLNFASVDKFAKFAETMLDHDGIHGKLKQYMDGAVADRLVPMHSEFWKWARYGPADATEAVIRAGEVFNDISRIVVVFDDSAFVLIEDSTPLVDRSFPNYFPTRGSEAHKAASMNIDPPQTVAPTIASMAEAIRAGMTADELLRSQDDIPKQ